MTGELEEMLREKYPDSDPCDCTACVHMCENRVCWPTPSEVLKLIEAGFANRLMQDYWVESVGSDTIVLSPAVKGLEGGYASFIPFGECTFLTKDRLCELHDLGLKPIEGRVASHKDHNITIREEVANLWRGDDVLWDVIDKWEEALNAKG